MREWFTFAEVLSAAQRDLPNSERSLRRHISNHGWRNRKDACQRRNPKQGGDLFHISLMPAPVQLRLRALAGETVQNRFKDAPEAPQSRDQLWERYQALPAEHKAICQTRLDFLLRVEALREAGAKKQAAIATACHETGFSLSTFRNWSLLIKGQQRCDWLAALAPQYHKSEISENNCHPEAWSVLKSDYLRPEKPSLASCYRRVQALAKTKQWEPLPSLRTMRRWVERELPRSLQVMAREKADVSKQLYPAQRRTRGHLHAMQMVNIDGHKFDVFVALPNGRVIRPMMVAIQDLYSNLFVAHRIDDSENKEVVRLTIGDMMEKHGIPETLVSDNGRAFASKQITGGQVTRNRYKIRKDEPLGLLTSMGVKVVWTTPYSGQSKPIERAFRDLCDTIARHPFCAGAYVGNKPDARPDNCKRAIPIEDFRRFVTDEIEAHNRRTDRNTEMAKGRSFLDVYQESRAKPTTLVPMPTSAQRHLWLLAAEQIPAQRGSGEIHLHGTRYWCHELNQYAGKKLTVRYDPQNLQLPIKVYSPQDEFLFEADAISDARFDNVDEARQHNRNRREYLKAEKEVVRLRQEHSAAELAEFLPAPEPMKEDDLPERKVRRIATGGRHGNAALKIEPIDDRSFEENIARALDRAEAENVIPFRNSDE